MSVNKIKVACYSCKQYDIDFFEKYKSEYQNLELIYFSDKLYEKTAILSQECKAVVVFVHDELNDEVLKILGKIGVEMISLRCVGFNNINLKMAKKNGIKIITRVPSYSPYSVAEHTIGLLISINRKIHKSYQRTITGNFSLHGFLGFDIYNKVVGIIGTGKIGKLVAEILKNGFHCKVLASDIFENPKIKKMGIPYVSKEDIFKYCDIITIHCPLTKNTKNMINSNAINKMKKGVTIINTSRGEILDTKAIIEGLKNEKIGNLAIDVYENEDNIFYEDKSDYVINDDLLMRLLTFPNVLITSHQAYFTKEAMKNITQSTLNSLHCYFSNIKLDKEVIVPFDTKD